MQWQDIVISAANVAFGYSLVSEAYEGFKKKKGFILLRTSGPTAAGLYAMSFAMFTLNLYISSVVLFINAMLWSTLFVQRIVYEKV